MENVDRRNTEMHWHEHGDLTVFMPVLSFSSSSSDQTCHTHPYQGQTAGLGNRDDLVSRNNNTT